MRLFEKKKSIQEENNTKSTWEFVSKFCLVENR